MDGVKRLFGVMMLALAAWMLDRDRARRASACCCSRFRRWRPRSCCGRCRVRATRHRGLAVERRAAGSAASPRCMQLLLLVGAARGAEDLLHPLTRPRAAADEPAFISVSSVAQLRARSAAAAARTSAGDAGFLCRLVHLLQGDAALSPSPIPQVREALRSVRLLRADVTANNADDQALLQQFKIFGPPTIAFYDAQGHEQRRIPRRRLHEGRDFAAAAAAGADLPADAPTLSAAAGRLPRLVIGGRVCAGLRPAILRSDAGAASGSWRRARLPAPRSPQSPPAASRCRHRSAGGAQPAVPDQVPDMTLPDLAGTPHSTARISGPSADHQFLGDLVRAMPARDAAAAAAAAQRTRRAACRSWASRSTSKMPCSEYLRAHPIDYPLLIGEDEGMTAAAAIRHGARAAVLGVRRCQRPDRRGEDRRTASGRGRLHSRGPMQRHRRRGQRTLPAAREPHRAHGCSNWRSQRAKATGERPAASLSWHDPRTIRTVRALGKSPQIGYFDPNSQLRRIKKT